MFTYISKGDSDSYGFLPAGIYQGKITKTENKASKAGDAMLVVYIKAFGNEGAATVPYYLVNKESVVWKIDQFMKNVLGLVNQEGQQVIINEADLIGREVYVKIGVKEGDKIRDDGSKTLFSQCEDVLDPEEGKAILDNQNRFYAAHPQARPAEQPSTPATPHYPASTGSHAPTFEDDDIPF